MSQQQEETVFYFEHKEDVAASLALIQANFERKTYMNDLDEIHIVVALQGQPGLEQYIIDVELNYKTSCISRGFAILRL